MRFRSVGLPLAILLISLLAIAFSNQDGLAQNCSNFWVNPQTGAEECLDRITTPRPDVVIPSVGGGTPTSSGGMSQGGGGVADQPSGGQTAPVVAIINSSQDVLPQTQLNNARAYQNPQTAPSTSRVAPLTSAQISGGTPGVKLGSDSANSSITPRAFGSFGVPYTHTRVSSLNGALASSNPGYLSASGPYNRTGRLNFRIGNSTSHCTATLIRRSVIVTAAHCIQNFGSRNSIFSNFTFVPGTYNGSAPYGTWGWLAIARPPSWANGTDTGRGSARNNDLAVIALAKSNGRFLGDRIGYQGYGWNNFSFVSSPRTGNLTTAATTTLGYPGLLDSGRIMQRVDGPSYLTTVAGARQVYQGGPLTGGSSGGPWLVNFKSQEPTFSGGSGPGTAANPNLVVGVTSWGSSDPNTPKDNYSSQFAQNVEFPNASYGVYGAGNIGALLNGLCNTVVGGSTLASQGFCS